MSNIDIKGCNVTNLILGRYANISEVITYEYHADAAQAAKSWLLEAVDGDEALVDLIEKQGIRDEKTRTAVREETGCWIEIHGSNIQ
jgi:aminopeptidase-like protein